MRVLDKLDRSRLFVFVAALLLALPLFLSKTAAYGSVTILHSFQTGGDINEGANLNAGLTLGSDGNFYGTAEFGGGATNGGMVFKMTPSGTVTTLHSFIDNNSDGGRPMGALVEGSDGDLYGTTAMGGNSDAGTVFKISKTGIYTILHHFQSTTEGFFPVSRLIEGPDGNFYGTLEYGGPTLFNDPNFQGYGSVFKMTPNGDVTILHLFKDGSVTNDGVSPKAGLTLGSDGNFYGTTYFGGSKINDSSQNGYGTAFKITPNGTYTILHFFNDGSTVNDGLNPTAALTLGSDGNFYGTTLYGGAAVGGTVFRMTPAGTVTVLHVFSDGSTVHDGLNPQSGLILGSDGNLYGTTQNGGSATYYGTVFKLKTDGSGYTIVHSFKDGSTVNDGVNPFGDLVEGPAGNLYGTTWVNSTDRGTVFRVDNATSVSFTVSSSGTPLAGSPLTFTVNARDSAGNALPQYPGTIHFTSSDPLAVLPADATLTNGSGTFSATFNTDGSQTITVTDTMRSNDIGTGNFAVTGFADHFVVTAPSTATAGTGINVTVTAKAHYNTTVTGYTGTVHFTSTDTNANVVLPADVTLTNGTGTFTATLTKAGTQTITATDTANSSITGTSGDIAVSPGATDHLIALSNPISITAGVSFSLTIIARDHANNITPNYTGILHFTDVVPGATLPADSTLTNGGGSFNITLTKATAHQIKVTDTANSSLTVSTASFLVKAAAVDHFVVTAPGTSTAGSVSAVSVTAKDAYNNTVTGYTGSVHFTSTDGNATLPADATLTNGAGTFSATLKTAGIQTVTATDTVNSSITGSTGNIVVSPGAVDHFTVGAPTTATAGTGFSLSVAAKDLYDNAVTVYTGTVHFTSTDARATLPADAILTNGAGAFNATLITSGSQTITATDTNTSSITGTSGNIAVASTIASRLVVITPGTVTAGVPFNVTVSAVDSYGNVNTAYNALLLLATSSPSSVLPASTFLANGTGTFSVTLNTTGSQYILAFDPGLFISGFSGYINVQPGPATHFSITAPGTVAAGTAGSYTVTALDSVGNTATGYTGTVHFTSTDPASVLPADATLTNGIVSFQATFKTASTETIRARDTINASITGTAMITVTSGAATHLTITTPATAAVGTALFATVTAKDALGNTVAGYTGTIHVSSTDPNAVLPANFVLTGGAKQISIKLMTTGAQTITVTDTSNSGLTATTGGINVTTTVSKFVITGTTTTTAGSPYTFTVTAKDAANNTVTNYSGTVHFTTTDAQAVLPADTLLTNGVGTFTATLKTATTIVLTATDTVTTSIKGGLPITVSAGAASQFIVAAPASVTSGAAFYATVTAKDAYGNLAKTYSGTVHFTSSDLLAVLPADVTLTNGAKQISLKLKTKPSQTFSATDTTNGSITGTSGQIAVN